jgi:hypothetical protein
VVTTQRDRSGAAWWVLWFVATFVVFFSVVTLPTIGFGYDSHAYWLAVRAGGDAYTRAPMERDAFLYSPLFRQLVWPLGQLPWLAFFTVWSSLVAAGFWWLLRPVSWSMRVPALLACTGEVAAGNVYAFMAVAIVLGVTRGWPWLLPGLAKVAPGVVGVVWHAARGDGAALRRGLAVGVAVVGVSYLAAPDAWRAWIEFLLHAGAQGHVGVIPRAVFAVDVVVGLALVALGARTGRPWTMVVATLLVSPTIGINSLTLLAALPRLREEQRRLRAGRAPATRLRRTRLRHPALPAPS